MKKISIVLPCLNEAKNLTQLLPEIIKNIPKNYNYEIIVVDDGSTDDTEGVLVKAVKVDKRVKGIIFHRRFGHQSALLAGIRSTNADAIITMDADFQHPPFLIGKFIKYWERGYDLISGQKNQDKTLSISAKFAKRLGYFFWSKISDGILIPGISDFHLLSRKVADYIVTSNESDVFLRGVVRLAAKNHKIVPYYVGKRKFGNSSYSGTMLFEMFIKGAVSFSPKPLRIASFFGLFLSLITVSFLILSLLIAIVTGRKVIEGFISIALLILVLNGFIIFYLGIIGEYLGIVFKETKKRPDYIIEKTVNF